jgi:ABC-type glycerol-3-phosphate transport system permease component
MSRSSTATHTRRRNIFVEAALVLTMLAVVVPIAWTTLLAFLPNRAIVSSKWQFPFWLGNYRDVFSNGTFARQLLNSVAIVVGTVILCLIVGSLAGYSLAKLRPPRWLTMPALVLAALVPLIPPATLVPGLYVLLNNELRTFLSIMVPLVKPGMAATGIFVGIMAWNEFLMGLTLTSGGSTAPVTVGIAGFLQQYSVTWGQLAAAGSVAAIPMVVLAIFANRHIVAGLTAGAVKG